MSKVYFGGLPTAMDVRKLIDAFGQPEEGAELTHEQVEAATGLDRNSNRYHAVTSAWRKQLRKDHNIDMGAVPGVGFRSLDAKERISLGVSGVQQGLRKQIRSIKRAAAARTDDPVLATKRDFLIKHGAALVATHNIAMREIEPPKPQSQMPRISPK